MVESTLFYVSFDFTSGGTGRQRLGGGEERAFGDRLPHLLFRISS